MSLSGRRVSVVLVLALLVTVSAMAQLADTRGKVPMDRNNPYAPEASHASGVKVTIDAVDDVTRQVDVTATVFYSTGNAFTTAWMGFSSAFITNQPALDWGDGATVPSQYPTGIPFDTVSTPPGAPGPQRAYRMSWSHSYGADGTYPIVANAHPFGGGSPAGVFTGHVTTLQTYTYSVFGIVFTWVQGSTSVTIPLPPVPTTPFMGLLVLGLVLGTAGFVLLLKR